MWPGRVHWQVASFQRLKVSTPQLAAGEIILLQYFVHKRQKSKIDSKAGRFKNINIRNEAPHCGCLFYRPGLLESREILLMIRVVAVIHALRNNCGRVFTLSLDILPFHS
jgi:hypothetical protein